MTECNLKDDKPLIVLLVGLTVFLGALVTTVLAVMFAYKFHTELDETSRSKSLPRLVYLIVVTLATERTLRTAEFLSWYLVPRTATLTLYMINNLSTTTGIFGGLGCFLTMKLSTSFSNSIYEVTRKELILLYSLVISIVICCNSFLFLNGIDAVKFSAIGQSVLFFLALSMLILSLTLLYIVDARFVRSLRLLIVSNRVSSRKGSVNSHMRSNLDSSVRFSQTGSDMSMNSPHFSDLNLDNRSINPSEVIIEGETTDPTDLTIQPSSLDPTLMMNSSLDEIQSQSSLAGIRNARLSEHTTRHQKIIKAASRSLNAAIFITVAFLLMFAAGLLFGSAQCSKPAVVIGHSLLVIAYPMISLSLSFSLSHSKLRSEYDLCAWCEKWLARVVVFQVNQEVIQREMSQCQ